MPARRLSAYWPYSDHGLWQDELWTNWFRDFMSSQDKTPLDAQILKGPPLDLAAVILELDHGRVKRTEPSFLGDGKHHSSATSRDVGSTSRRDLMLVPPSSLQPFPPHIYWYPRISIRTSPKSITPKTSSVAGHKK